MGVAQCDHATCTAAGTCDKCIHETAKCNTQSCDPRNLPRCHDQHIHCRVVEKQMPPNAWVNSSFHQDGTPLMTNGCSDGARFAYTSCHNCDTSGECSLTGLHKTLVVTHDRTWAHMKGQKNSFHCYRSAD